jgi:RimJ/RimL family protein N-acetyltransferase
MSRSGRPYLVQDAGDVIGYVITDGASTLVEYHATDAAASDLLDQIVERLGLRRAFCKTFDVPLREACSRFRPAVTVKGLLFRRIDARNVEMYGEVRDRSATTDDIDQIMAIDDGFYRDADEASSYVRDGQMTVYETDGRIVGCGLIQQVVPSINAHDIGMMVAPRHRRRGLGRYIVRHLIQSCLASGKRPICGCHIDNIASRRCLESAGFRSEHELLELSW